MCGMEFISKAIENDVLVIQGDVFSKHDTHFRLSFAVPEDKLELGLTTLKTLLS
jgi:aspartate aminotransferase